MSRRSWLLLVGFSAVPAILWPSGGTWADESAPALSEAAAPVAFHVDDASLPRTRGEAEPFAKASELCKTVPPAPIAPAKALCEGAFSEARISEPYRYQYECAFVISPMIGGVQSKKNVWLQPAQEASLKRVADNEIRKRVCDKTLPLEEAQKAIADDWPYAYRRWVAGDVTVVIHEPPPEERRPPRRPVASAGPDGLPPGQPMSAGFAQGAPDGIPPIQASVMMGADGSGLQSGGGRGSGLSGGGRGGTGYGPRPAVPMPRPVAGARLPGAAASQTRR